MSTSRETSEHQTEIPTASAGPAGSQGQHLPVRVDELDQISTGSQRDMSVSVLGLPTLQLQDLLAPSLCTAPYSS